jgi:DNA-binding GntR family transcriptional regulator
MEFMVPAQSTTIPSRPQSLPDVAYRYVREAILRGELQDGAPLKQHDLAAILGISPLPLREALRRLEVEGWVVLRPRRGYVVASLTRGEIEEVFEIQGMLEERAAYHATQRRTQADVAGLQATQLKMDQLLAKERLDVEAFSQANDAFHEQLFAASARPYYCRMLRTLRNTAERYVRLGASIVLDLHKSQAEHHAIVDAFRLGNPDEVARRCRVHRENTRERLLTTLEI